MSSKLSFIAQHYLSKGSNSKSSSTDRQDKTQHNNTKKLKPHKFKDYGGLKIKDDSEISTAGNKKLPLADVDSLSGEDDPVVVEYKDESRPALESKWTPITNGNTYFKYVIQFVSSFQSFSIGLSVDTIVCYIIIHSN